MSAPIIVFERSRGSDETGGLKQDSALEQLEGAYYYYDST